MGEKEVIKDFGKWICPTNWNEVTLKQFSEIERYYSDKDKKFNVIDVLHILCDKSIDEINALPISFSEKLLEKLSFLQDTPNWGEPTNKIEIDGTMYIINVMEKLKTGEYVAVDTILKSDPHNYAAIMAVLCRKEGEKYDSKFEAEEFEKRVEMFDKQPVTSIMRLVGFFLNLYMVLETPSLLSSEIREGISHIRRDIENSKKNGALSALSTKRLMKKLKKLEKSINSI